MNHFLKNKDQKRRSLFAKNELNILITKGSFFLRKAPSNKKKVKDSSMCRSFNRCLISHRSRGVLRPFRLSRGMLREHFSSNLIPGLTKSSW
jgi:ribosomal protein S14